MEEETEKEREKEREKEKRRKGQMKNAKMEKREHKKTRNEKGYLHFGSHIRVRFLHCLTPERASLFPFSSSGYFSACLPMASFVSWKSLG
jgi:hypothetical protein